MFISVKNIFSKVPFSETRMVVEREREYQNFLKSSLSLTITDKAGVVSSLNRFIIVIGILICLLNSLNSYAADITSAQTGKWNVGSTWVGGVAPGAGDNAVICSGHTVTLGSPNTTIADLTVQTGAILNDDNRVLLLQKISH